VGSSWPWSYGNWIYNYLCNQCPSPLMLWVRILIRERCTTLYDKVCQWLATGLWFSPSPPVSSINKTDHHDVTEILLKVVLNTIKPNWTEPNLVKGDQSLLIVIVCYSLLTMIKVLKSLCHLYQMTVLTWKVNYKSF
jgi:hypothetical protein